MLHACQQRGDIWLGEFMLFIKFFARAQLGVLRSIFFTQIVFLSPNWCETMLETAASPMAPWWTRPPRWHEKCEEESCGGTFYFLCFLWFLLTFWWKHIPACVRVGLCVSLIWINDVIDMMFVQLKSFSASLRAGLAEKLFSSPAYIVLSFSIYSLF